MRRSPQILTPRPVGRALAETDFDELFVLHRDPAVIAAFDAEPQPKEETRAWLERKLAHWRDDGFGISMFHDATGSFVAFTGEGSARSRRVMEKAGFVYERDFVDRDVLHCHRLTPEAARARIG